MSEQISVKVIHHGSKEELAELYQEAGWWEPSPDNDDRFLDLIIENSAIFVGAFDKKRMIGMGRALSDMASDAYIQDVVVLKPYRGEGVGQRIVRELIQGLKAKGVDWIGLVAQPGTCDFYHALGFEPLKGYAALKYKDK